MMNLYKITKDKLLHTNICGVVAGIVIIIAKLCGCVPIDSCGYGWFAAFIFGISKEIYNGNKAKASDWLFDIIGATLVCLFALILML